MVNKIKNTRTSVLLSLLCGTICSTSLFAEHVQSLTEPESTVATGADQNALPTRTRRKPGESIAETESVASPAELEQADRVAPAKGSFPGSFIPIPDRWRLADTIGIKEGWLDPYNRNLLKADRPVFDDWFFSASVISDTLAEYLEVPTAVGIQTSDRSGSLDVFGKTEQNSFNQNLILALVFYKGNTVFQPPDYEFRITPVFNYNQVSVKERGLLNIDPREDRTRHDTHIGMQELFLDVHLRNVSERYDFDSIRVGIQPFSVDFRGFLFQDNQLGVRLFGTRDNNFWQYNLAWFQRLEKDTNSGLNSLNDSVRKDHVFIANLYRQDFPVRGFISQVTTVYNRNREGDKDLYFDENGFLVRPASLGDERGRDYDAYYLGYNGDGHFGRLNLTTAAYYLFGRESNGLFVTENTDISAFFFAGEASVDFDWIRLRVSGLFSSGDDDPFDKDAEGFDAIFENPIFAGSDSSYWIRQGVPNIGGGGVRLSGRNAIINSLRSSKEQGQSNFTNPGTVLIGVGADFDILPELRLSTNVNKLYFDTTEVLEAARNQGGIDRDIGWDLSVSLIYRPLFSQNIVFRLSGAALIPGDGFEELYDNKTLFTALGNLVLTY